MLLWGNRFKIAYTRERFQPCWQAINKKERVLVTMATETCQLATTYSIIIFIIVLLIVFLIFVIFVRKEVILEQIKCIINIQDQASSLK